jgi:hypothetical protein
MSKIEENMKTNKITQEQVDQHNKAYIAKVVWERWA